MNEGNKKTYEFAITDPGDGTHTINTACGTNGTKVEGSYA